VGLRRDPECGWCIISYLFVPKQRQQQLHAHARSKPSIPPLPVTQLKLHHLSQAHFTVKVSLHQCVHQCVSYAIVRFFQYPNTVLSRVFFHQCVTSSSSLLADFSNYGLDLN